MQVPAVLRGSGRAAVSADLQPVACARIAGVARAFASPEQRCVQFLGHALLYAIPVQEYIGVPSASAACVHADAPFPKTTTVSNDETLACVTFAVA